MEKEKEEASTAVENKNKSRSDHGDQVSPGRYLLIGVRGGRIL